jgi:programmed cell death protein 5
VNRIAIVKPEKARALEDTIIQMAQRGQLPGQIDENKFIELLNRTGAAEEQQRTKVTVQHILLTTD